MGGDYGFAWNPHGDYAKELTFFVRRGELDGVRYLSPKTVDLMTTNQISVYGNPGQADSDLASRRSRTRRRWICVGGLVWLGWRVRKHYKVDPKEGLVMVFMINQLPLRADIAGKFPTLVYQALVDSRACRAVRGRRAGQR